MWSTSGVTGFSRALEPDASLLNLLEPAPNSHELMSPRTDLLRSYESLRKRRTEEGLFSPPSSSASYAAPFIASPLPQAPLPAPALAPATHASASAKATQQQLPVRSQTAPASSPSPASGQDKTGRGRKNVKPASATNKYSLRGNSAATTSTTPPAASRSMPAASHDASGAATRDVPGAQGVAQRDQAPRKANASGSAPAVASQQGPKAVAQRGSGAVANRHNTDVAAVDKQPANSKAAQPVSKTAVAKGAPSSGKGVKAKAAAVQLGVTGRALGASPPRKPSPLRAAHKTMQARINTMQHEQQQQQHTQHTQHTGQWHPANRPAALATPQQSHPQTNVHLPAPPGHHAGAAPHTPPPAPGPPSRPHLITHTLSGFSSPSSSGPTPLGNDLLGALASPASRQQRLQRLKELRAGLRRPAAAGLVSEASDLASLMQQVDLPSPAMGQQQQQRLREVVPHGRHDEGEEGRQNAYHHRHQQEEEEYDGHGSPTTQEPSYGYSSSPEDHSGASAAHTGPTAEHSHSTFNTLQEEDTSASSQAFWDQQDNVHDHHHNHHHRDPRRGQAARTPGTTSTTPSTTPASSGPPWLRPESSDYPSLPDSTAATSTAPPSDHHHRDAQRDADRGRPWPQHQHGYHGQSDSHRAPAQVAPAGSRAEPLHVMHGTAPAAMGARLAAASTPSGGAHHTAPAAVFNHGPGQPQIIVIRSPMKTAFTSKVSTGAQTEVTDGRAAADPASPAKASLLARRQAQPLAGPGQKMTQAGPGQAGTAKAAAAQRMAGVAPEGHQPPQQQEEEGDGVGPSSSAGPTKRPQVAELIRRFREEPPAPRGLRAGGSGVAPNHTDTTSAPPASPPPPYETTWTHEPPACDVSPGYNSQQNSDDDSSAAVDSMATVLLARSRALMKERDAIQHKIQLALTRYTPNGPTRSKASTTTAHTTSATAGTSTTGGSLQAVFRPGGASPEQQATAAKQGFSSLSTLDKRAVGLNLGHNLGSASSGQHVVAVSPVQSYLLERTGGLQQEPQPRGVQQQQQGGAPRGGVDGLLGAGLGGGGAGVKATTSSSPPVASNQSWRQRLRALLQQVGQDPEPPAASSLSPPGTAASVTSPAALPSHPQLHSPDSTAWLGHTAAAPRDTTQPSPLSTTPDLCALMQQAATAYTAAESGSHTPLALRPGIATAAPEPQPLIPSSHLAGVPPAVFSPAPAATSSPPAAVQLTNPTTTTAPDPPLPLAAHAHLSLGTLSASAAALAALGNDAGEADTDLDRILKKLAVKFGFPEAPSLTAVLADRPPSDLQPAAAAAPTASWRMLAAAATDTDAVNCSSPTGAAADPPVAGGSSSQGSAEHEVEQGVQADSIGIAQPQLATVHEESPSPPAQPAPLPVATDGAHASQQQPRSSSGRRRWDDPEPTPAAPPSGLPAPAPQAGPQEWEQVEEDEEEASLSDRSHLIAAPSFSPWKVTPAPAAEQAADVSLSHLGATSPSASATPSAPVTTAHHKPNLRIDLHSPLSPSPSRGGRFGSSPPLLPAAHDPITPGSGPGGSGGQLPARAAATFVPVLMDLVGKSVSSALFDETPPVSRGSSVGGGSGTAGPASVLTVPPAPLERAAPAPAEWATRGAAEGVAAGCGSGGGSGWVDGGDVPAGGSPEDASWGGPDPRTRSHSPALSMSPPLAASSPERRPHPRIRVPSSDGDVAASGSSQQHTPVAASQRLGPWDFVSPRTSAESNRSLLSASHVAHMLAQTVTFALFDDSPRASADWPLGGATYPPSSASSSRRVTANEDGGAAGAQQQSRRNSGEVGAGAGRGRSGRSTPEPSGAGGPASVGAGWLGRGMPEPFGGAADGAHAGAGLAAGSDTTPPGPGPRPPGHFDGLDAVASLRLHLPRQTQVTTPPSTLPGPPPSLAASPAPPSGGDHLPPVAGGDHMAHVQHLQFEPVSPPSGASGEEVQPERVDDGDSRAGLQHRRSDGSRVGSHRWSESGEGGNEDGVLLATDSTSSGGDLLASALGQLDTRAEQPGLGQAASNVDPAAQSPPAPARDDDPSSPVPVIANGASLASPRPLPHAGTGETVVLGVGLGSGAGVGSMQSSLQDGADTCGRDDSFCTAHNASLRSSDTGGMRVAAGEAAGGLPGVVGVGSGAGGRGRWSGSEDTGYSSAFESAVEQQSQRMSGAGVWEVGSSSSGGGGDGASGVGGDGSSVAAGQDSQGEVEQEDSAEPVGEEEEESAWSEAGGGAAGGGVPLMFMFEGEGAGVMPLFPGGALGVPWGSPPPPPPLQPRFPPCTVTVLDSSDSESALGQDTLKPHAPAPVQALLPQQPSSTAGQAGSANELAATTTPAATAAIIATSESGHEQQAGADVNLTESTAAAATAAAIAVAAATTSDLVDQQPAGGDAALPALEHETRGVQGSVALVGDNSDVQGMAAAVVAGADHTASGDGAGHGEPEAQVAEEAGSVAATTGQLQPPGPGPTSAAPPIDDAAAQAMSHGMAASQVLHAVGGGQVPQLPPGGQQQGQAAGQAGGPVTASIGSKDVGALQPMLASLLHQAGALAGQSGHTPSKQAAARRVQEAMAAVAAAMAELAAQPDSPTAAEQAGPQGAAGAAELYAPPGSDEQLPLAAVPAASTNITADPLPLAGLGAAAALQHDQSLGSLPYAVPPPDTVQPRTLGAVAAAAPQGPLPSGATGEDDAAAGGDDLLVQLLKHKIGACVAQLRDLQEKMV